MILLHLIKIKKTKPLNTFYRLFVFFAIYLYVEFAIMLFVKVLRALMMLFL